MKELGGYIELDTYGLPMLHDGAVKLNCGRNALAYLLRARRIKRVYIPKFICDSVTGVCEREGVPYTLYGIGKDLLPSEDVTLGEDEWLYFVDYYSLFDNETIGKYVEKYRRVIVDSAQSYFREPVPGADTLYTCRKYFGTADGAFLYTDAVLEGELEQDESFGRMRFLLGRFEKTASEFYPEYVCNNKRFANEPIKRMSKLTENLLHAIDYGRARKIREDNYTFLHSALGSINGLELSDRPGTFMYPLMLENGAKIRAELQKEKIYIPILWPNVAAEYGEEEAEHKLAECILPLPIDQRYGRGDMERMTDAIKRLTYQGENGGETW